MQQQETAVQRPNAPRPQAGSWKCVLELDRSRAIIAGAESALCQAIRAGADLRVGTGFRHNEHIDLNSDCGELIHEFMDFRVTYLLEDRWTAGICNLRMPVDPPEGFKGRESMSFFLYNQDGQQAIARCFLDEMGRTDPSRNKEDGATSGAFDAMPGYTTLDRFDSLTNAPSSNFIYEFDFFRFCVADRWTEVLSHDANGRRLGGSLDDLVSAFRDGAEVKVAIRGLCSELEDPSENQVDHDTFVHVGSTYYYTERKLFIAATHPVVRVKPSIPLAYRSRSWDFGWLLPRTDGIVARWLCDPHTLRFRTSRTQHAMRWFVG